MKEFIISLTFIFIVFIPFRFLYPQNEIDINAEEISVQLTVQKQGSTIIPAILVEEDIYLPVIDIFMFLKIKADIKPGMKHISGFFINEDERFLIDVDKGIIQNGKNTIPIDRDDFILSETNIFMKRVLFGEIFGLECRFNFRMLEVFLTTDLQLPVIREMMRERARKNLQQMDNLSFIADTIIPLRHSWLQGGFIDWSFQNNYTRSGSGGENTQAYSFAAGMEILGGATEVFLNSWSNTKIKLKDLDWKWRYVRENNPFFSQITIGKFSTVSIPSYNSSITGIQVTNTTPTYRRAYGTYLIQDFTEPDWIVELYVNQQLVDFVKADAAGLYQFAVPLAYGPTYVTLKFIGPWGEERSVEKLISIPYTFIPAGQVEYTISAGEITNANDKKIAQLNLQAGLTNRLTIGSGLQYYYSPDVKRIAPSLSLSYRVTDEFLFTGEYVNQSSIGGLLSYTNPSQAGIEVGYTRFSKNSINYYGQLEERKAAVTIPLRFSFINGIARLNLLQSVYEGSRILSSIGIISTSILGIQTNLTTSALWNDNGAPNIRSAFSLSFRAIKDIIVRPQTEFDFTINRFSSFRSIIERPVFSGVGWVSLGYSYDFLMKSNSVQLDFRYDLPFMQLSSNVYGTDRQFAFSQSSRGTIGFDSPNRRILFDNRNWVQHGGIVLRPFLDLNYNGIQDEDEQSIQNLDISISGGRILPSDDKSIVRITELQPYMRYDLTISPMNFEDISWKPRYKSYSIAVDPNQFKEIQIPIVITGEISGFVRLQTPSGYKVLGGTRIFIEKKDGTFSDKILTLAEGDFYLTGLYPGDYTAYVDPAQLQLLSLVSDPPAIDFKIQSVMGGAIIKDINFLLKPVESINSEGKK